MKNILQLVGNLSLLLFGVVGALALLEVGARLLGPPFPIAAEAMHQCHADTGWLGEPNFTATIDWYGYEHQISLNDQGMHDTNHPLKKDDDIFRIMLIGDSFVEAAQVNEAETSHAVLESRLNAMSEQRFEVINAGALAWGPQQALAYFRTQGHHYQPDLIIVMWVPANDLLNVLPDHVFTAQGVNCYAPYFAICNDQFDAKVWRSVPGLPPIAEQCGWGQKLLRAGLSKLYRNSYLFQRIGPIFATHHLVYQQHFAPWLAAEQDDPMLQYAYNVTFNIYRQLVDEAAHQQTQTVFAIVPFNQAVYTDSSAEYATQVKQQQPDLAEADSTLPNRYFMAHMDSQNLPVYDLHADFVTHLQQTSQDLHWTEDFHWNVAGNRLVGERLADWLVAQELVPSP
ncbi:hypothetical protein QUF64_15250 [Anaerolineales bacterium HSG6]|nr:hypothetical protein [Anaerolineales bacterium HSG6]MDM8531920.1 hypothetical protein [Anaerolineales bacterium HSG25]